ncbi:MAG: N-6 DNA methylase [Ekhidna sp.]|nr:N-6 DNA methylase [Ekhidna sp.]
MLIPDHQIEEARVSKFLSTLRNLPERQEVINKWRKLIETGKIIDRKEESIRSDFIQDIFVTVLGYSSDFGSKSWSLEKELKTRFDGRKPDVSLGYFSQEPNGGLKEDIRVVVEVKGPQVTLDKKQHRKDFTGSPVEQGFNYAYRVGSKCKWVMVTNFLEIRLYRSSDINEYHVFKLSALANREQFGRFLYLLHEGQLFLEKQDARMDHLYRERQQELRVISNEFYGQYRALRELLFFNLLRQNPEVKWQQLFSSGQKLIDRIIFICFVKDLKLVGDVLAQAKRASEGSFKPSDTVFWEQLLHLFDALDQGYVRKNIPPFNGGLFRKDAIINALNITDGQILEFIEFTARYNFRSQLGVNILGHIFEQSVTDLEELKTNIRENQALIKGNPEELEKLKTSRRKRDGIYYTPDYITRYIVREAAGGWLEEQKESVLRELGLKQLPEAAMQDYLDVKKKDNKIITTLTAYYTRYQKHLKRIKVLDPACGSGAFLTEVFDYLYAEWETTELELRRLTTPAKTYYRDELDPFGNGLPNEWEIKKNIILHNLYGVDLNAESVEITKLSLWLKTTNRKNSLASLTDNIKQGNSLISDSETAGEDAFNWEQEFPEIMEAGGFDVVVGNPPYFSLSKQQETAAYFEKSRYETYQKGTDIYVLFYERGIRLLKEGGNLSYITSNSWLRSNYGLPLRKFIRQYTQPISLLEIEDKQLFEDAVVESNILALKKGTYRQPFPVRKLLDLQGSAEETTKENGETQVIWNASTYSEYLYDLPQDDNWILGSAMTARLKEKIKANATLLGDLKVFIKVGIITGLNEAFIIDAAVRKKLIDADPKSEEIIKPILRGRDVQWYQFNFENQYVINTHNGLKAENIEPVDVPKDYPEVFNYLKKFKPEIEKRQDQGKHWSNLRNCAYLLEFDNPKIIWGEISDKPKFTYEEGKYYQEATTFIMTGDSLKYILGILNSHLSVWYFHLIGTTTGMGTNRWKKYKIEQFPIADAAQTDKAALETQVDKMLAVKRQPAEMSKSYLTLLTANFPPKKALGSKLKNRLWSLTFADVLVELGKSDIKIPAKKQKEWLELFQEEQKKAKKLQSEITETEKEINRQVYALYGLNEEEIAHIEGSI